MIQHHVVVVGTTDHCRGFFELEFLTCKVCRNNDQPCRLFGNLDDRGLNRLRQGRCARGWNRRRPRHQRRFGAIHWRRLRALTGYLDLGRAFVELDRDLIVADLNSVTVANSNLPLDAV
ncbi:MAG TPA: hypothetical protein PL196_09770, partial [Burkholderiaceae bacterium]|nr:hypothetical protein [Burkholderiaceae bacterium]